MPDPTDHTDPTRPAPPGGDDFDPHRAGEELDTSEGVDVPAQQAAGKGVVRGGGEFPDPNTPPQEPAPGAVYGTERYEEARRNH